MSLPLSLISARGPEELIRLAAPSAWYDHTDLSTLFQDATGTTPAALTLPVGLRLDKSRGLARGGEELTAAPTLSNGWADSGGGTYTHTGTSFGEIQFPITVQTGQFYEITVEASGAAGSLVVQAGAAGRQALLPSNGIYTVHIPAGTSVINAIRFITQADGKIARPISAKLLPGNHASQATAPSRPVLRAGSRSYIDYDTVDDALVTTFAAPLGSSCTVARSIPGVGAQILTGQTIGATFSDTTDSHGLLIFDRALTAPETAAVTRWCAGRAGL